MVKILKNIVLLSYMCVYIVHIHTIAFSIPVYDSFVTDMAGSMTVEQEHLIEKILSDFEKDTTVEIAVLVVDTLQGGDVSQLAVEIGQEWGVGKENTDNGIVFLVAIEDRKRFIVVGYGLEGVLTDAIVKRIGERHIPTYFRNQEYFSGIYVVIQDIIAYIQQDEEVMSRYSAVYVDEYETNYAQDINGAFAALSFISAFVLSGLLFHRTFSFVKNFTRWLMASIGVNSILFLLYWLVYGRVLTLIHMPVLVFVTSGIMFFIMFVLWIDDGKSGGGGSSYGGYCSSGSSGGWSSGGGSWSSSSSTSFGGGSFGGGGAGGSW